MARPNPAVRMTTEEELRLDALVSYTNLVVKENHLLKEALTEVKELLIEDSFEHDDTCIEIAVKALRGGRKA